MTDRANRILAAALGRAEQLLAAEHELGRMLWDVKGRRCYGRQNGPDFELTIASPGGSTLRTVLVGVDGALL